ncbi:Oidioi.mRNA.OKI2018_I69.chr2.g7972.t1.cds [Oikopleura dioica]|uniref:Oidioi.mRNA.OKI2018_I69.chr2.g7972.t1.cds n=1 Tax=Oikopleura dioica TaxID=34765 RepID=A0ABN7TB61_OIKDI|nr:Oidioi.mRNA.OKI2018_I69.chr2.g7972.t1.cds [Oikopleura dioica]
MNAVVEYTRQKGLAAKSLASPDSSFDGSDDDDDSGKTNVVPETDDDEDDAQVDKDVEKLIQFHRRLHNLKNSFPIRTSAPRLLHGVNKILLEFKLAHGMKFDKRDMATLQRSAEMLNIKVSKRSGVKEVKRIYDIVETKSIAMNHENHSSQSFVERCPHRTISHRTLATKDIEQKKKDGEVNTDTIDPIVTD